jgi:hypothetical protein
MVPLVKNLCRYSLAALVLSTTAFAPLVQAGPLRIENIPTTVTPGDGENARRALYAPDFVVTDIRQFRRGGHLQVQVENRGASGYLTEVTCSTYVLGGPARARITNRINIAGGSSVWFTVARWQVLLDSHNVTCQVVGSGNTGYSEFTTDNNSLSLSVTAN